MAVIRDFGVTDFISTSVSPFVALTLNVIICILLAYIYKKLTNLILNISCKKNCGGDKNEKYNN